MTHSHSFSQAVQTPMLRGVNTDFIRELFEHKRLDTPLMLLSRSEIQRNYQTLSTALPRAAIHYAVKSNNHQVILDELRRQGGNFDVCSASETDAALRTGVSPQALVHTHPIKPVDPLLGQEAQSADPLSDKRQYQGGGESSVQIRLHGRRGSPPGPADRKDRT